MDTERVFELHDPGRWWLVTAGFVDVFGTRIQSGKSVSARFHICRFDIGAILFGLPETDDARFIAVVSADAVVQRLDGPPRDGGHPADLDLAARIDVWLSGLLSACRHEPPVAPGTALSGRGSRAMTAGSMIHSAQGVTWIAAPDGRMAVPGQERRVTITDGSFFPATRASSVLIEDAAEVQYADTATWLTRATCWQEFAQANRIISTVVRLEMDLIHSQESRQRSRRAEFEQRMVRDALSDIAGVLDEHTGSIPAAAPEAPDDVLLSACRSVGRVAGIQFTLPVREDATVDALTAIARASKVRVRRVRLRPRWWRTDSGPLLGYQGDDAQPVALLPVSPGRYVIHNPVSGAQTDVSAGSAGRLSAEAVVFYRSFPYKVLALGDLLGFGLRNSRKDVLSVPLLGLSAAFLGLLIPIAAGVIFNTIIPAADRPQLGQIILGLIATVLGVAAFRLASAFARVRADGKFMSVTEAALMDRLLRLPVKFFRGYSAGDLAARVNSFNTLRTVLSGPVMNASLDGIYSLASLTLLFFLDVTLAFGALGLVLTAIAVAVSVNIAQLRIQRQLLAVQGRISGLVFEIISGISKLRVAGRESHAFAVWARDYAEQIRLGYRARTLVNVMTAFAGGFPVLASIVLFAMISGLRADFPTGTFVAFQVAFGQFLAASLSTVSSITGSLDVLPLFERMTPILRSLPEEDSNAVHPGRISGAIEMAHVTFRYDDGPVVLSDISISVEPGEFVAFVGPSGSGKSTILRLLLGFEKPESGTIYYDGKDLAGLDPWPLRRQIGVVLQHGQLFPGSILDNIVGSSTLTPADAEQASRMAGLENDLARMPMGIHTMIGEGATTLSGGQRQRVMIARAIVTRPRILLFDEATSALDNKTQSLVSKSLDAMETTRIVIAHRLSTIQRADRICLIQEGSITQSGTFDELASVPGAFADFIHRQMA